MSQVDLKSVYEFAKQLAQQAGREIKLAGEKRWHVSSDTQADGSKKNSVDLVTETDQRVEKIVKDAIAQAYPSHKFVGEESFAAGATGEITDAPTWIVDPIDGTTNFVHGFPHVCISIGFTLHKKPVIGVIYNPFLDTLYEALSGQGAFCNGVRLPFSHPNPLPLPDLGSALIGAEYGSIRDKDTMERKVTSYKRLAGDPAAGVEKGQMCHSIRSIGSAALLYSFVAAGVVIAEEAGGRCYGKGGKAMDDQGVALMGRHFFVIRGVPGADKEAQIEAQDRLAKRFFETVIEWDME